MISMIQKGRTQRYIQPGLVSSLTFYSIPKVDTDAHMVHDGMRIGLNEKLWDPWFPLPTTEHHLRAVVMVPL